MKLRSPRGLLLVGDFNRRGYVKLQPSEPGSFFVSAEPGLDDRPIVTVEDYLKWYELFVVRPRRIGTTSSVSLAAGVLTTSSANDLAPAALHEIEPHAFPDMGNYEALGSHVVDHVPNPLHVVAWCDRMGFELHPEAFERIVGRWEIEVNEKYHRTSRDEHEP